MKCVLSGHERRELTAVARSGKVEHRVARRANAILLFDKGWSCEDVAEALFLDDDTVRSWLKTYVDKGLAGLKLFEVGGSASDLKEEQVKAMADWVDETHPTSTRQIGRWIKQSFGVFYSRSGLVKLLARAGLIFHKPTHVPRTIDADAQRMRLAIFWLPAGEKPASAKAPAIRCRTAPSLTIGQSVQRAKIARSTGGLSTRAVTIYAHGGNEQLRYETNFPDPKVGEGDVLVRIRAVSINYHDIFTRRGMPGIHHDFPWIMDGFCG